MVVSTFTALRRFGQFFTNEPTHYGPYGAGMLTHLPNIYPTKTHVDEGKHTSTLQHLESLR